MSSASGSTLQLVNNSSSNANTPKEEEESDSAIGDYYADFGGSSSIEEEEEDGDNDSGQKTPVAVSASSDDVLAFRAPWATPPKATAETCSRIGVEGVPDGLVLSPPASIIAEAIRSPDSELGYFAEISVPAAAKGDTAR